MNLQEVMDKRLKGKNKEVPGTMAYNEEHWRLMDIEFRNIAINYATWLPMREYSSEQFFNTFLMMVAGKIEQKDFSYVFTNLVRNISVKFRIWRNGIMFTCNKDNSPELFTNSEPKEFKPDEELFKYFYKNVYQKSEKAREKDEALASKLNSSKHT